MICDENKKTLSDIEPKDLNLYHVEISGYHDMPEDALKKAVAEKLSKQPPKPSLNRKLADVFQDGVKAETLIIVQSPTTGK